MCVFTNCVTANASVSKYRLQLIPFYICTTHTRLFEVKNCDVGESGGESDGRESGGRESVMGESGGREWWERVAGECDGREWRESVMGESNEREREW